MIKFGSLSWHERDGEGRLKLSPTFYASDRVLQLDALVDWRVALQDEYERVLKNVDARVKK